MPRLAMGPLAISLTGSGHLLIYQLGVCKVLLQRAEVQHVSGSSGGAIVAALLWHLPSSDSLAEYANEFIKSRGDGISLLRKKVLEESNTDSAPSCYPTLSISATSCRDGKLKMFDFESSILTGENYLKGRLLKAVEASCKIPPSFHPYDMLSKSTYPEEEGVEIDKGHYVDGGIAAPVPPTPLHLRKIVVSPISGPNEPWRISPPSTSRMVPSIRIGNLAVSPTLKNLRALRASVGMTTSLELQDWYRMGETDAQNFIAGKGIIPS
mmetsp:Transcript_16920/g.25595  ORF Transcript_16920/g.25595 Transcript_16920/m.25595 type:complete len:267 (-) Transcript_16920:794-1594(-)